MNPKTFCDMVPVNGEAVRKYGWTCFLDSAEAFPRYIEIEFQDGIKALYNFVCKEDEEQP